MNLDEIRRRLPMYVKKEYDEVYDSVYMGGITMGISAGLHSDVHTAACLLNTPRARARSATPPRQHGVSLHSRRSADCPP